MSKLLIKEKQIVVPGETLAEGMDFLPGDGTFRDKEQIVSQGLGLATVKGRLIKLIPLAGKYSPKRDDIIVAKVKDIMSKGWMVNINTAYHAMITLKDATSDFIPRDADLSRYYKIGDWVLAKITRVTQNNLIDLSMREPRFKKLDGGRLIEVNPTKVPRIIGKKASMISLIKEKTDTNIQVGQNGWIWLKGDPHGENLAVEAIKKIERESHKSGLTEEIEKFLDEGLKRL